MLSSTRVAARAAALALTFAIPRIAAADPSAAPQGAPEGAPGDASREAINETPIVAYTYAAGGSSAGTLGAQAYGTGLTGNRKATLGGGATVWGAPIARLTVVGDFARDVFGNFAPSVAAIVPILGNRAEGLSLGALGKFKVEGFAVGPNQEVESEVEAGLLLSYAKLGWHVDVDAITGFGLGDDGEIDSEARLRAGYDVTRILRLGIDGQGRWRLNGTTRLPGNRNGDFVLGAQTVLGSRHFFGAITAGPSSMGITDGNRSVGFSGLLTIGGTT